MHISKYYYPFLGGTEQVARDMVRALKGTGARQRVICFNGDVNNDDIVCRHRETRKEKIDDVIVYRCGYQFKISSQAISTTYGRVLDKMNEFKPNIVILHYPNPFVTHYLLKYKKRPFRLLVYWHMDITKQKILKKLIYHQIISLIKWADRIIHTASTSLIDITCNYDF